MFIFWLSPNKEKKNLHSTRVYLYVYFFIIPKQERKKKNYTVLEFTKLEYCVNFFFFFKKKVLEFTKLEYHKKFFNHINPAQ